MKKALSIAVILIIALSIAFHFVHGQVYKNFWYQQMIKVEKYGKCEAGEPEQYRVVQYLLISGVFALGETSALHAVFYTHGFVLCLAFLAMYFYYKRLQVDNVWLALSLACYPVIYSHAKSGMAEGYYLEIALYLFGFLAMMSGRWWWILPLSVVGTFNRETIFMLPVIAFIYGWGSRKAERICTVSFLLVVAVQVWLRYAIPVDNFTATPNDIGQGWRMIVYNLSPYFVLYFLGFVSFIPLAFRSWPERMWPVALLIPVYFIGMLIFGNIVETRMMMLPFVAYLIPAAMIKGRT